jgi:hypothetical protein
MLAAMLLSCKRPETVASVVPLATLHLDALPENTVGSAIAFASEDLIAVGRHPSSFQSPGTITTVRWRDGKLYPLATLVIPKYFSTFGGLYSAANGSFFSTLTRPPELLSEKLTLIGEIQSKIVFMAFSRPDLVVEEYGQTSWRVLRFSPQGTTVVQHGPTGFLSLSDRLIAYQQGDEIKTETLGGQQVGTFTVMPRASCDLRALIVGVDELFLNDCDSSWIVDLNGKRKIKLPEPDGWGFRYSQSNDGKRMLFDHYTRRVSSVQQVGEFFQAVVTFGAEPNEESTGEIIRVVDTTTGKVCLDLDRPTHQLGMAGEHHADVSPSGDFIAVSERDQVSIYAVPKMCK